MDSIKKQLGYHAASFIEEKMIVGIGTGSTTFFFIEKLIERVHLGLKIQFIASSSESFALAKKGGLQEAQLTPHTKIDITVDGADEIDKDLNLIKGGGGALFREKMLAYFSKKMIVIAEDKKLSPHLGKAKLPVEILPFASPLIIGEIERKVGKGALRKSPDGTLFVTDNGNLIFDISPLGSIDSPEKMDTTLRSIPGVIETGLFFNLAKDALIGYQDGNIKLVHPGL